MMYSTRSKKTVPRSSKLNLFADNKVIIVEVLKINYVNSDMLASLTQWHGYPTYKPIQKNLVGSDKPTI
jgi:hypothetical protein